MWVFPDNCVFRMINLMWHHLVNSAGFRVWCAENIPQQIGNWKMINAHVNNKLINKWEFMNEVITRTYCRSDGKIVWLAITYGSDQRQVFALQG